LVDLMSPIEVSNQHKIPVPQISTIIKATGIKPLEKLERPQEGVSKEQSDPLSLLRHYTMNDKTIKEDGNHIIFGKFSWPKSVKTNFRIVGWEKKEAEAWEYYTLESLWYFLKNQTLCHLKYSQDASNKNIYPVRRADRRAVLDYLTGLKADSVSIQKSGSKLPDLYKVTEASSHLMANKSNAFNKIEMKTEGDMDIERYVKIKSEIKNKMTDESWDMDAHVIASSDSPIDVDTIDSGTEQGDSYKLVTDTDVGLTDNGEFELPIPVPALKPMNHGLEVADAVDMRWTLKEK